MHFNLLFLQLGAKKNKIKSKISPNDAMITIISTVLGGVFSMFLVKFIALD